MATARRAASTAIASASGAPGGTRDRKRSRKNGGHVSAAGIAMAAERWWGALLVLALLAPPPAPPPAAGSAPRKVQIGVRKRPERCGARSRRGDVLTLHYSGQLEDGTQFDSSLSRDQPFVFSLGTGQVIKGWDQGLLGMCEGEKRKLVIPPELGYGDRGAPPKIPGGAVLIFEVELLKIERRPEL